jgi:hypothetical protein
MNPIALQSKHSYMKIIPTGNGSHIAARKKKPRNGRGFCCNRTVQDG